MNIVLNALRYEGVRLNLKNKDILNCLIELCSSLEDFENLKMVSFGMRVCEKVDQACDNFMLKYAKEQILKCQTLKDFEILSNQVFYYGNAEFQKKVNQAWDDFARANVNIEEEILKCQTLKDFDDLLCQLPINSKFWKKVDQARSDFMLKYVEQELLKCATPEDYNELYNKARSNPRAEKKFFQVGHDFMLKYVEQELLKCATPEDYKKISYKFRYFPESQKKVNQAWDNFMLKYVKEQILNCKALKDFRELRNNTRYGSEAQYEVDIARKKFVEQVLPSYSGPEEFIEACNIFYDKPDLVIKIITAWSKMGQKK